MTIPKEINSSQIITALDLWVVGRNAQRNREIMKRHFIDGVTYELISEEFDLSDRQVKNVVYKYQDNVFAHVHEY